MGRFLQIVRNSAYEETSEQRLNRIERLERQLNDPASCMMAALRLEAIGKDAVPALQRGLHNSDLDVRFHSAQALTYLDQPDGIAELEKAALNEPDFRWHALTALASSSEVEAGMALSDLMHAESPETRYGAFRSMLTRSPKDPLVAADPASGDFYLHVVPTTASSLIHFATQNRPEIVVFGGDEPLEASFLFIERGLTIRVADDGMIELTRFNSGSGQTELRCPNSTASLMPR